jgi:hypothetical protein
MISAFNAPGHARAADALSIDDVHLAFLSTLS